MPKLRVWESCLQHRPISRALLSTRLELFLLPAQRCAQNWSPYRVFKDSLGSSQARRLKSIVCEGEGYEMCDRTENRVFYFSEKEDRTINTH